MRLKLLLLFYFFTLASFAQQEASVWYFGMNAGLKFLPDGSVTALSDGKLKTNEGCASIANSNGDLLFYTDGRTVWDKNHVIMPNGDYAGGTGLLGDMSSTQSAIIVPKPGNVNIYYIFTLDEPHHENAAKYPNAFSGNYNEMDSGKTPDDDDGLNNGLNYSIVDLSIVGTNGSVGDIISRNNHLITYDTNPAGEEIKYKCSEKLTAVKDASGNGFWVITQFTDNVYAFKVTATGVVTTPVKSAFVPSVPTFGFRRNAIGYLKASPDGKKLAAAYDQIDTATSPFNNYKGAVYTFDFDNLTGVISNSQLLIKDVVAYGVEFSSNSKILYASFDAAVGSYQLVQFDLMSANIPNSKIRIFGGNYGIGALQLAPNNKIYFCTYGLNSLAVINNPDVLGLGCNYDKEGQQLAPNTKRILGLPPFITSFFDAFFDANNLCLGSTTQFALNSAQTVTSAVWDFGDGTISNAINPSHSYATAGTFIVTVTAAGLTGSTTKTKEIVISKVPTATTPQNLLICDDNNDGFYNFDLTAQNVAILNGQAPSLCTIKYFANAVDYTNNLAIPTPTSYTNVTAYQQETILAEISNNANPACKTTTSFTIDVFDSPLPNLPTNIPNLSSCDNTSVGTETDGKVVFDLTQRANLVLNGQLATQFFLSYYRDAALAQVITSPTAYQNTNPTETIYVKMVNIDNIACFAITSFVLQVFALPVITAVVDLKQCDDDIDGFSIFNLEEAIPKISNNASTETISFFKTIADAQINVNPITNTTAHTNQTVSNDVVYVRVENMNNCFRIAKLNLIVSTTQIPLNFSKTFTQCDDTLLGTNSDGIASFDFSTVTNQIQSIFPAGQLLDITYYRNLNDALAEKNTIANISNYRNIGYPNSQKIYIRVDSKLNNDCLGLGSHITLNVETVPIAIPITETHCDDDQDGMFSFDTATIHSRLLNGLSNVSVTYFDQNNNALSSPLPNPFTTASQVLKVRVTNNTPTACSYDTTVEFIVSDLPEAFSVPMTLTTVCDDEAETSTQDGKFAFDTSTFQNIILGGQTAMIVKYFDQNNNLLPSPLPNPFVTATQNVRVEVINPDNLACAVTVTLPFVINPVPIINLTGDELVCSNLSTFTKIINTGLLDVSLMGNYNYVWAFNKIVIPGETNYALTVNKAGLYTVDVINMQGCSSTRTIIVSASDIAKITDVNIVDLASFNSITISVTGAGDYVYGLDDEFGNYQEENVFNNVSAGIHTVFVKDLNGCGIVAKEVAVLGIPNYFTPNEDGFNDYWNIKGTNTAFNTKIIIHIFDRYGKLIKQISPLNQGWDGTFNGQQMPASDYWYSIQLEDGRILKGHFSLKR
ncbi:gliding motility-associated-like protein [Flavobacterium sp. CG_9.1]|uniref:T9SS type B sorting domain-containing protein n=1 Tax=Flavobacterium sp. CG_9.1 TaxID=2787728 RepID=UPI0018CBCE16|nr:gliding motility-associated-like protein [Flavobacterium sp. CG_9.1]